MTWADFVLRLLLSRRNRDAVSGDLLEAYREDILPSRGPLRARLWYWRQVFGFVSPAMAGLAMGTSLGVESDHCTRSMVRQHLAIYGD